MKTKIISMLLCLVMVLGMLVACGQGDPPPPACTKHVDANKDGICDNEGCGKPVKITCDEHVDDNQDMVCDVCKDRIDVPPLNVYWEDDVELIMQINRDSNGQELPDGSKRYLAGGEDSDIDWDWDNIDNLVEQRNEAAYEEAKVSIRYTYFEDGQGHGWATNVEPIYTSAISDNEEARPDIFVNFVYDMVAASLKGAFANLYGTVRGQGNNYFTFSAAPNAKDTGDGYMYEYMRSLTLSKEKMYIVASDYFIDTIRSFFIVPVNISLLNSGIEVDPDSIGAGDDYDYKYNSDRTGDGKFDIDDLYALVNDREWNYNTLLEFCDDIKAQGEGTSEYDLRDTVGFALSGTSGLSASGMLYTTSVTIIDRGWNDEWQDYDYSYPEPSEATDLIAFCENLNTLINNQKGVIVVGGKGGGKHGFDQGTGEDLVAIRNRFKDGFVLFGGVILIGSLEYEAYQSMGGSDSEEAGFGILPVPLYRDVNPETGEPDLYQTQIHNLARVGGIAVKSSKFEMCTAFLQYQSTHSTEILNEYYDFKLQYEVAGGSEGNITMLKYIRENVRSAFDKAFEDALGRYFKDITDGDSDENKWHTLIMKAGYKMDNMSAVYEGLYGTKQAELQKLAEEYGGLPDNVAGEN